MIVKTRSCVASLTVSSDSRTMRYFITTTWLIVTLLKFQDSLGDVVGETRIVGGVAVDISNYPYQLSLQIRGAHICGASIISNSWAVTAAHCCGKKKAVMTLRAGTSTRAFGGALYNVSQKIVHPKFSSTTADYDIALLKVSPPFQFGTEVAPIALPAQGATIAPNTIANISGWGTLFQGSVNLPTQLQATQVPIVGTATCKTLYGSAVTPRMICAGTDGKDACQGDSGGPLAVNGTLIGITSWGRGCAKPKYFGVYANVAALRPWIQKQSGL